MKMKKKLSENILDKFSIDFLRNQVLKNAYGNDDTVIARLDPRILRGNPKFCVTAKNGANREKFIMGGRREKRLPPC